MADKVTFTEASKALGIHINTIKNWQKAGRLPSATKVKPPVGSAVWMVNLEEAAALVRHEDRDYVDTEPVRPAQTESTDNQQSDNSAQGRQSTGPGQPPATAYLMALQVERDRLITQISNLQEERADYRQALGELRGQVGRLEKEIGRLETDRGGLLVLVRWLIAALVILALVALVLIFLK